MSRERVAGVRLLLATASALFLELCFLRWIGGEAPVLAYFKNFPLLAAFLGMGVGARLARARRDLAPLAPLALGALAVLLAMAEPLGLGASIKGQLDPNLVTWERVDHETSIARSLALASLLLALLATGFVAMGQVVGRLLDEAGTRLGAYGLDLAGGLVGVLAALAALGSGIAPARLVAPGLVAFALSARTTGKSRRVVLALALGAGIAAPLLDHHFAPGARWSPYYRIDLEPHVISGVALGERLSVNRDLHQVLLDLSDESLARNPNLVRPRRRAYALPWLLMNAARGGRVIVAGAGTGNDVAEALRRGASEVVALELDPAIAAIGRERHPERPYAKEQVRLVADDARAALRSLRGYDVLVYGLLDAHASLAAFGSLRHEEYVYTVEGIRAGLAALSSSGVAALTFYEGDRTGLGDRITRTVTEAQGRPPVVTRIPREGRVYLVFGPHVAPDHVRARLDELGLEDEAEERLARSVPPTTDDWPFLYANPQGPPLVYLGALAGLVLVTVLAIAATGAGSMPRAAGLEMLLLGAAFLLLETKGIADLARLFGATWLVTGLVLAGIFSVLLVANAVAARVPERLGWVAGTIAAATILAASFVPRELLDGLSTTTRAIVGVALVAGPIGFGGAAFSRAFARVPAGAAGVALGVNLAGAAIGGGLEGLGLFVGLRALGLIAAGLYATWAALHAIVPQVTARSSGAP